MEKSLDRILNITQKGLVEFIEKNEKLVNCKFSDSFKYTDAKALWVQLSEILNSCNGANKTWKEWRKTWQDMKSRTKTKRSDATRQHNKTGGGQATPEKFTDTEEKILHIVGKTCLEGHVTSVESSVQIIENENNINIMDTDIIFEEVIDESTQLISAIELSLPNIDKNATSITNDNGRKKKRASVQRLDNTIKATNSLADISEKTFEIKKKYYEEKIALMKRDVEAKEKIANCLEKLIPNFSQ